MGGECLKESPKATTCAAVVIRGNPSFTISSINLTIFSPLPQSFKLIVSAQIIGQKVRTITLNHIFNTSNYNRSSQSHASQKAGSGQTSRSCKPILFTSFAPLECIEHYAAITAKCHLFMGRSKSVYCQLPSTLEVM
jgi:hypothetical protein